MSGENIEEFRMICAKAGYRKDYQIAQALGISKETLSRKFNGKSQFSVEQINKARAVFSISEAKAAKLFL